MVGCPARTVKYEMLGKDVTERIEKALLEAAKKYFQNYLPDSTFPENEKASLQLTRESKHGDLTSNIAMRLAASARCSPILLGEGIVKALKALLAQTDLNSFIGDIEVAGGFINFRLSDAYFCTLLQSIYRKKSDYGRSDEGKGVRVNLEFVSANPTGPLTIAHGRQAAIGDALSRILAFEGYDVTNEYYLNDFGRQIKLLGD